MNANDALQRSDAICRAVGLQPAELNCQNFPEYFSSVNQIVMDVWRPKERSESPWLQDWAVAWRKLYDDFESIIRADPMILYVPKNRASREFHSSPAYIRYFRAGNRTSKTQSGYAEHYLVTTGQHKWRYFPPPPNSSFIISFSFSAYMDKVFLPKMFLGENADPVNPLAPMFPENGKWFYHWDSKFCVLTIACPVCAEAGKAGSCKHQKSTIKLYSAENAAGVIEGFVGRLAHIDEHVPEEFHNATLQRLQSASHASMIVTGTPLHGLEAWETRKLAAIADGDPSKNLSDPDNPQSPPYCEMFQIDQFEAGIVPPEKVRMLMARMDEFEIESRIYGRPSPLAENPVFDRKVLYPMRQRCVDPLRGELEIAPDPKKQRLGICTIVDLNFPKETVFHLRPEGPLRIWEKPIAEGQYIIGADSAAGLSGRDASCASVLKLTPQSDGRLKMDLVAQYHGWVNVLDYADVLKLLAVHYNCATVVIELTGGHGRATMLRLRKELFYWNIFLDQSLPEVREQDVSGRLGVETNASTKPMMVGALQQVIKAGLLDIKCYSTIGELVAFEQEREGRNGRLLSPRYRGAGGSADDRTMSLVIAVYVAVTFPVLDFLVGIAKIPGNQGITLSPEFAEEVELIKQREEADPFY